MSVSYLVKGDTPVYRCASLGKEKSKWRRALAERVSYYFSRTQNFNATHFSLFEVRSECDLHYLLSSCEYFIAFLSPCVPSPHHRRPSPPLLALLLGPWISEEH
jgi:hypothetical protein